MTCQVRDEEWLFSSEAVECDLWHLLKRGSFEIDLNWQGVATTFYEHRVLGGFWTVPPHFQCQNEPTSSFFTLKISWNCSPGWLQLVFHFSTENREEQLKCDNSVMSLALRVHNYFLESGQSCRSTTASRRTSHLTRIITTLDSTRSKDLALQAYNLSFPDNRQH